MGVVWYILFAWTGAFDIFYAQPSLALEKASHASCLVSTLEAITSSDRLKIGDELKLKDASGHIEGAVYLGYQEKAEQYLFITEKDGHIRVVPREDLSYNGSAQKLLEISKQQGPTCAVHSTKNCLTVLESLGLLRSRISEIY